MEATPDEKTEPVDSFPRQHKTVCSMMFQNGSRHKTLREEFR